MSVLIFFVVLFVLILVHEWGHFIVAKKTGMRVDEFGIGFPPRLFGVKKGETTYSFNALPIGGFVRIWGENYEDAVEDPTNDGRGFSQRPKWAQALVLIAGVTMNILFAWLLFTATFMIGVPTAVDEAGASPEADLYVASVLQEGPASVIPPGAAISSVAYGEVVINQPKPSEFSDLVVEAGPNALLVTYDSADGEQTVELFPEQGLIAADPERYAIGVSLTLVEVQSRPVHIAIKDGFIATYQGIIHITVGLYTLLSQTFVGEADFSQVAGPVGIVGMVGDAAAFGITALLTFTAIISLNLAVINLLPFPALDGGRLVFVFIESITGKHIPPEWAGRVNLVGFAILMLLMIAVTYNDITRLI